MFAEQILSEIDATLEQLICNARSLQGADPTKLSDNEIDAFQKTQESLLHHLMYMDSALETKSKQQRDLHKKTASYKIQEKAALFEKLNSEVNHTIRKTSKKMPITVKRRCKKLLKACS